MRRDTQLEATRNPARIYADVLSKLDKVENAVKVQQGKQGR
jgi:hypothetical protein